MKRGREDAGDHARSAVDETPAKRLAPGKVARTQASKPVTAGDVAQATVEDKGFGSPLEERVASRVGNHLGADFSEVRVHGDEHSRDATSAMGARAFAHGKDIFLGHGESATDVPLMAHELTHVVQQGASKRTTPQAALAVEPQGSAAEIEADEVAEAIERGPHGLIVDREPEAGQMGRAEFLQALRAAVTNAADDALGPLESAVGCPYIDRWFARHQRTEGAALERLAKRYSYLINASTATAYIPPIVDRLRNGIKKWRQGQDVTSDLRAAGFGDEAADAKTVTSQSPETVAQKIDSFGPSEPLPGGVSTRMGAALDDNFGDVQIHTGVKAAQATAEEGATAMTVGTHIAFSPGAFSPGNPRGDALLAHELAHTQQQRAAAKSDEASEAPVASESSVLEENADAQAGSALGRLWGNVASGARAFAKRSADVIKAPLGLQRCDKGTEPSYDFEPHREGPHSGQRVGVFSESGKVASRHVLYARDTIGEAESESEAVAIAKVDNGHAVIIAADGVFFVYKMSTPEDIFGDPIFNPILVRNAGLIVDSGIIAVVTNANVFRPGEHHTATTEATEGAYEETFEPYLELHDGELGNVSEPEFLAVFEAAMRDNVLKVLADSQRQAEAKREQFEAGPGAVSASEKSTMEETAKEALKVQTEFEKVEAERIQLRNQRSIGPAGPINIGAGSEEQRLEERERALQKERRVINLKYPMLGRYKKAKDLQAFISKDEGQRMAALASDASSVLSNIRETRNNVLNSELNLWLIRPIIDSTIAGLRVGKETEQRKWVDTKADKQGSADRNANIALAVLGIGLGLAAAFAPGGAAALILTAGAVGVGVYDAVESTERYFRENAATDTDIDKIDGASLLPESMRQHWGWLVLAWAGVALDTLDVVRVAGQVAEIGRGAKTVDEAAQALAAGNAALLERLRRAAGDIDIADTISEANRASVARAVGAELEIDPRMGRSVEVQYDVSTETGRIVVGQVKVGAAANVGDIVAHADTVRMLRRHGTLAARLRSAWTRLKTFGKTGGNPFPPKSPGFNSWQELEKLDGIMATKHALLRELLQEGANTKQAQDELRRQLAFLENEVDIHRRVVDTMADMKGGRGAIAMNDDTRAALEAGKKLPDLDKPIADISAEDLKASAYYFRRTDDGFETVLKPDRIAPPEVPTPLVRSAEEIDARVEKAKSGFPKAGGLTDDVYEELGGLPSSVISKLSHAKEADLTRLAAMLKKDPTLAARLEGHTNPFGALKASTGTDPGVLSAKLFADRLRRLRVNDRVGDAIARSGVPWTSIDNLSDADLVKLKNADAALAKARQGHRPGRADISQLEAIETSLDSISSVEGTARKAIRAELSHGHGLSDIPFMRDPAAAMRTKFAGKIPDTALDQLAGLHPDALRALETMTDAEVQRVVRALTGATGPKDVQDILRSYMYKAQKKFRKAKAGDPKVLEPPQGVADKLEESLSVLDEVRKRGFPYGFATKVKYEEFMTRVKAGLKRRDIDGEPKVQGSSMHNRDPGDIDMEIVVTQTEFDRLAKKFHDAADSDDAKLKVADSAAKQKIPSYQFHPDTTPTLADEVKDLTEKGDVQATLIVQGSDFDLGPFL